MPVKTRAGRQAGLASWLVRQAGCTGAIHVPHALQQVAKMVQVVALTTAIPTVSEWGLLATALLLVGVGGTIITRRQPA